MHEHFHLWYVQTAVIFLPSCLLVCHGPFLELARAHKRLSQSGVYIRLLYTSLPKLEGNSVNLFFIIIIFIQVLLLVPLLQHLSHLLGLS